ncbi:septum site-determining protein MinC [Thiobacillus sp.]|uniref:septum site-determining protein MinC n=1 Tax=Thiobacillus sp. TaxID=924 RepID=UPI0011D99801|nr:septum site-determining protein MinC [Thiobacillus sp.]MBC2730495.1 septum site-determining protein MinC [Thiobacillus sp.]MBC2739232.1 septum site-determining protein MinC [Thiobacillus sp.]MBC2760483.1 septum site-determining protein MinC [Thiobacillus sp.]TXH75799.1 MAG: septum site-determining protein MinC [Thiobacillus sp.]
MPRRREPRPAPALELKTTRLAGIQVILNSAEHAALDTHLSTLFAATPDFFGGEAAVFECGRLPADAPSPDWAWLARELKSRGLNPFAVQNASAELAAAAQQAGLLVLNDVAPAPAAVAAEPEPLPEPEAVPAPEPAPSAAAPTRIIDKPLRSGQRVYAAGGDIVVLAAVNPGAEVIADGSIHVYAPLKGRALAGARGDTSARIFTTHLEAELVSIAGVYRTFDAAPDAAVARKPAQIRLADASQIVIEPL